MGQRNFRELLEQVRNGSEEASRELYARYGHHVMRVVRRHLNAKLRPKFDSLDFAQDVWASFFAARPSEAKFESPTALAAFLAQIARNKVRYALRQRLQGKKYNLNRENSLDGSAAYEAKRLMGPDPTGSQACIANEEYDEMVDNRPTYQRMILDMAHQGHSHLEIAAELGVNEKTIRRLLKRLQGEPDA